MRIAFFVLLMVMLQACTNTGKVPPGIIPSHKMETILWQLMQSDEYVNRQSIKDTLKKSHAEKMKIYQQVFDLNETSLSEFKKSYQYYMAHPDITKIMFDSISVRAAKQRSDMYKPKPVVKNIKTDTLKPVGVKLKPDSLKAAIVKLKTDTLKSAPVVKHKKHRVKKPAAKLTNRP